jgi:formylglycine-generating enzyme required for sulfatase activity
MKAMAVCSACLAIGCQEPAPPRAQAIVWVDTDAPAPRMVDRLRIELIDAITFEPACDDCLYVVALDESTQWPVSFAVTPPEDERRVLVRLTLHPATRTAGGFPLPETSIERVAEVQFGDEILEQDVFMTLDCAGVPSALPLGTTCEALGAWSVPVRAASPHVDAPSRMGTWRMEVATGCADAPRPDTGVHDEEICIPGGVFWMGDYRRQGFGPQFDAVPEHAVAVGPIFLDKYEFTVGRYRALKDAGVSVSPAPTKNCHGTTKAPGCDRCNLPASSGDDENDAFPLNCVSAPAAEELCAFYGARLPSEAEWEWAGGSREEERLFAWGNDVSCDSNIQVTCIAPVDAASGVGSSPVATNATDLTIEGLQDMSGSLFELMIDTFQTYADPCWKPGSYGSSPFCAPPPDDPTQPSHGRVIRGTHLDSSGSGSWSIGGRRALDPPNAANYTMGFRCARSAAPAPPAH